jgi:hypothetical protein
MALTAMLVETLVEMLVGMQVEMLVEMLVVTKVLAVRVSAVLVSAAIGLAALVAAVLMSAAGTGSVIVSHIILSCKQAVGIYLPIECEKIMSQALTLALYLLKPWVGPKSGWCISHFAGGKIQHMSFYTKLQFCRNELNGVI